MRLLSLLIGALTLAGCTLSPTPNKWDFGTVWVGTTHTSNNITWTNTGSDPVDVLGVMTSFQAGDPFVVTPAAYQASTLGKNAACNPVRVVFSPVRAGTWSGKLEPLSNAGGKTVTAGSVSIAGAAYAQTSSGVLGIGGAAITPGNALDFGRERVGANPGKSLRIDIVNGSTATLTLTYRFLAGGGPGFAVDGTPATITAKPGRTTIKLRFAPTRLGKVWSAVEFIDQANGANIAGTALTGEGTE
ncbi:MAG: choice-of-anchor D domain-containing protein [Planctomycetes bacterium]|nr:choice-of-anchor D domain-containing protein [Planctomycetota bacterium]